MPIRLNTNLLRRVPFLGIALFWGCDGTDSAVSTAPVNSQRTNADAPGQNPAIVKREHYIYTTRPLTRKEAAIAWLPLDGRNVRFAEFRERLAWQVWVRFEASPDSCRSTALRVLQEWNRANPENAVDVKLRQIDTDAQSAFRSGRERPGARPYRAVCREIPLAWFAPEHIRDGLEGGGGQGNTVKVWIDLSNSVVFYQEGSGSPDTPEMVLPEGF